MPDQMISGKTILVLGAYGFIGAAITRSLQARGATVRALVRSIETGAQVLPGLDLVQGDLRDFTQSGDWHDVLTGVDYVVNCAGALQDGHKDDLEAVHHRAIAALAQPCASGGIAVIQISAIGANPGADTDFMRTKAAGDAALAASGVPLWILRPGLVIGQSDYGGTALLRMLAAVPIAQPITYPQTPVQCIGMPDLCDAVTLALSGHLPQGTYDLVEATPHTLSEVVAETRRWMGFPRARINLTIPASLTGWVSAGADMLGHLGWRSPMRRNAMKIMAEGVVGNSGPYCIASGRTLQSLPQIYAAHRCSREHRLAARMALLMPLVVGILCLFWVLSGLFGLLALSDAMTVLTNSGWSAAAAAASVAFWSLVDIALGLALLWRPWAARTCLAQAGVALFYLLAATLVVPALWSDPMGPLVKILPAMMLSLVAWPMLQSR